MREKEFLSPIARQSKKHSTHTQTQKLRTYTVLHTSVRRVVKTKRKSQKQDVSWKEEETTRQTQ